MNGQENGIVSAGADLAYLNGGAYYNRNGRDFANDATMQHGLHYNRETTREQNDCNRSIFGQAFDTIQNRFEDQVRGDQINRLCDKISNSEMRNTDNQIAAERRLDDKIGAISKQINDDARESLRQFCDLKEGQAEIKSSIETTSLKERNQSLEDQLAEQRHRECCPAPARCVDPCCGGGSGGGSSDTQVILQAQAQQFQAMQQTMTAGLGLVADAIKTINCSPGNSGNSGNNDN